MRPIHPTVGSRPAVVIGLLLATFLTAAFGNTLQPIPILAFLHPYVLLLTFECSLSSFRSAVLAYTLVLVVQALGLSIGFAGAIAFPRISLASLINTFGLCLVVAVARTFGALFPSRHLRLYAAQLLPPATIPQTHSFSPPSTPSLSPIGWLLLALPLWVYPIFNSAVTTLIGLLLGCFLVPAVAFAHLPAVAQLTSLIGVWGIGFLLDLIASAAYVFSTDEPLPLEPSHVTNQNSTAIHDPAGNGFRGLGGAASPSSSTGGAASPFSPASCCSRVCKPLRRHVMSVAVAVGLLAVVGEGLVYSNSFYQKSVNKLLATEQRLPVSCLTSEAADVGSADYIWLWQRTAERVAAGDRFVLWSEGAVSVRDHGEELALLTAGRDLLAAHGAPGGPAGPVGTYLGLCFTRALGGGGGGSSGRVSNQFVLLDPNGTILWDYHKAHPVPVVEAVVEPGRPVLPTAPSLYGTLGGAICFDLDWPSYIRQAGAARVSLLLQPSWTWGDVGPRHFASNALRAVENGFTTLRCSSSGVSGAVSPRGVVWHYLLTGARDVLSFTLPLYPRTTTAYVLGGWMLEWGNLAAAGLLLALILVPRRVAAGWVLRKGGPRVAEAEGEEPLLPH